ncbi:MAG: hypothetical protein GXO79_05145, partial [Chlorobi bacterium]|nr:hypothetical protein [Chlorobiota bacterium]
MKKNQLYFVTKYIKKALIIVLLTFLYPTIFAQTGVFYFVDKPASKNNNKIVDLVEIENSELCLIGKISDEAYKNPKPYYLRIDKNGRKLKQTIIKSNLLYEVNKLIKLDGNQLKIFGSQLKDDKYSPFNNTIDINGVEKSSDYSFSVFSTLLGDVMVLDKDNLIMVDTKLGKSKKYSITLNKINANSNKVIWNKSINSKDNEEANQLFVTREKSILVLGKRYNSNLSEYLPILYKYSSDGELIWSEKLDVPKNFNNQSVCSDKKENIYYICSYTKETTGKSETRIIKLSPEKIKLNTISIESFSGNGIIPLSNGNFIVYGSNLKVHEGHVITKGKFVIMDKNLGVIKQEELSILTILIDH